MSRCKNYRKKESTGVEIVIYFVLACAFIFFFLLKVIFNIIKGITQLVIEYKNSKKV